MYADVLQEIGDPRGEYIALQLRAGTGKPSEREIELATQYRASWLGPLDKVLAKKSRFQNGFLYERGTPLRTLLEELGRERVVVALDGPGLVDVGKQLAAASFRRR